MSTNNTSLCVLGEHKEESVTLSDLQELVEKKNTETGSMILLPVITTGSFGYGCSRCGMIWIENGCSLSGQNADDTEVIEGVTYNEYLEYWQDMHDEFLKDFIMQG